MRLVKPDQRKENDDDDDDDAAIVVQIARVPGIATRTTSVLSSPGHPDLIRSSDSHSRALSEGGKMRIRWIGKFAR
jgi:hypothetical protein